MKNTIPYTKPSITSVEIDNVADAVANGWGENCYEYIKTFERNFAKYLGVKHAVATSSCTGALTLGLHASGVKAGDEVILADTNWIATVAPIVNLGAKPVFVDIKADTWCIEPKLIEEKISARTKAIIATHLYGNLCDMYDLVKICKQHGIALIEDSAEAFGAEFFKKKAGSIGDFGVFSFHGTKTLTTGEGGMFVTNDHELYERVLTLNNHGRPNNHPKQFWPIEVGHKFKMSNIDAALGCAQLSRAEELTRKKHEVLEFYRDRLTKHEFISMNPELDGIVNGAWMPTVVFDQCTSISREQLQAAFKSRNIDARVFFWPLTSLDMFESEECHVNAYSIPARSINLPSFHDITTEELDRVCKVIEELIAKL